MASSVDICNVAASFLGAEPIASLADTNKVARVCARGYAHYCKILQAKFQWDFNKTYALLQALDETPPAGYSYIYALPSDCLVPRKIDGLRTTKWEIFGRKLATSVEECWLTYSIYEEITGKFSSGFEDALAAHIAMFGAMPITKNIKIHALAKEWAVESLNDAILIDANVGNQYKLDENDPDKDTFVTGESES